MEKWTKEDVGRIQIGWLGVDIVECKSVRAVKHALATTDLVRLEEAVSNADLQWPVRLFLMRGGFITEPLGSFMGSRGAHDKAYVGTRRTLDEYYTDKAAPQEVVDRAARNVAEMMVNKDKYPNDEALDRAMGKEMAHFCADRFGMVVPDEVFDNVQLWKLGEVHKWMAKQPVCQGLEPSAAVDIGSAIHNPFGTMVPLFRLIANDPTMLVEDALMDVCPVPSVVRMTTYDTTLAGLVPENNPVKKRFTVVRLYNEECARKAREMAWVFSGNGGERTCPFYGEAFRVLRAYKTELNLLLEKK